jgi:hypothetical protein
LRESPRGDVFDNKLCNDSLTSGKFLIERRVKQNGHRMVMVFFLCGRYYNEKCV